MLRDQGQARRKHVGAVLAMAATMASLLINNAPRAATADTDGDRGPSGDTRLVLSERSAPLMEGMAAEAPSGRGTATFLGGYDGAHETALFRSQLEVRLLSTVSILGGVTLAPAGGQNRVQPRVALKAQLLAQSQRGLDLAVAVGYRKDRYTEDEGAMEAVLAAARTSGRWTTLGSAGFLSDMEGDDRKGDLRLSLLRNLGRSFQLGLGGSGEFDLRSTDRRRGVRRDPSFEAFAGPLIAWNVQDWVVLAQAGGAAFAADGVHAGVRGMLGATTSF
jgi:hypothetical protein